MKLRSFDKVDTLYKIYFQFSDELVRSSIRRDFAGDLEMYSGDLSGAPGLVDTSLNKDETYTLEQISSFIKVRRAYYASHVYVQALNSEERLTMIEFIDQFG